MTTSAPQQSQIATPEQVVRAFAALSLSEQQRLRQIARLRALGIPAMTWEDLLHEALVRTLAGKRQWPLEVNLVAFLAQTMRSIANEERERTAAEPIDYAPGPGIDDEHSGHADSMIEVRTPESELMARSTLQKIEHIFATDAEAIHILHGLAEGLTPAETQMRSGMTRIQYASAQKRIQRALTRRFGKASNV